MKKFIMLVSLVLIASWLLAACGQTVNFSPAMSTAVANTVVALQQQTSSAATATQFAIPTSTTDPYATFTPIPTLAPTTAPTSTPLPELVISDWSDNNYSINTKVKTRETFTKTFTLTNGGSATWQKDYKIVQVSGDSMGFVTTPLNTVVAPGDSFQFSMTLTAPTSDGTHRVNFMLETPNGFKFGYGDKANLPFFFELTISADFRVTSAEPKVKVPSGAACPVDITLYAEINANGAGDVTYYFTTSQGHSDTYTMTFTGSGSKVSDPITFTVTSPDDLVVSIYVDNPNHQTFPSVTVTAPCTP